MLTNMPAAVFGLSVLAAMLAAAGMSSTARSQPFDCLDIKCREISSCAEATYKLYVCGHTDRDGDDDGIPCEHVCGKSREHYAKLLPSLLPGARLEDRTTANVVQTGSPPLAAPATAATSIDDKSKVELRCSGKRTCREMTTCAEATFYLEQCGVRSLDGNGDGIACNALCR